MELQENYEAFRELNAEIVAVAQEEADASSLTRLERFVKNAFPVVADPEKTTRDFMDRYGVYLADKEGNLRVAFAGTKTARPRLDLILRELAAIEGKEAPATSTADGKIQAASPASESKESQVTLAAPANIVDVRWMWSHDKVRPGDTLKLAICPVIADGFHVYAPWEGQMSPLSVEIETPPGVKQLTPVAYPVSKTQYDAAVDLTLASYEGDVPLSTLVFEAGEELVPGELTFRARVSYQACDDRVCLPPRVQVLELELEAAAKESKRQEVYGWGNW